MSDGNDPVEPTDDVGASDGNDPVEPTDDVGTIEDAPTTVWGILRRIGPGLIVAGSIVGSGELIATTVTGAQAGFWLLWLIIIGCVIKVFVQVELGRYAITHGKTTMTGLNEVPGPTLEISAMGKPNSRRLYGNWLIWFWMVMFLCSLAQLGGIVGAVGQALSISVPLTDAGREYNDTVDAKTKLIVKKHEYESEITTRLEGEIEASIALLAALERDEKAKPLLAEIKGQQKQRLGAKIEHQHSLIDRLKARKADAAAIDHAREQGAEELYQLARPFQSMREQLRRHEATSSTVDQIENHDRRFRDQVELLLLQVSSFDAVVDQMRDRGVAAHAFDEFDGRISELNRSYRSNTRDIEEDTGDVDAKDMPLPAELIEQISDHATNIKQLKEDFVDDKIWAAIITVLTALILIAGRYKFIQTFSVFMVASFTLITIINLFMLQNNGTYAVTWNDIVQGMSFRLPEKNVSMNVFPLATALMTFGIIGVGASELITYPYWCLERGYGRWTGPRDDSSQWAERAKGWLRVMRWDAWCSMVVYTFATIAFYLLGAAILGRIQLKPEGTELIRTLSVMYEPVFGAATQMLFLFGAFAVLYSTFFVANASHARVFPDALRVCGIVRKDEKFYRRLTRIFSGVFPFLCLIVYVIIPAPLALVMLSATMQAIMLPMVSLAAIYFRYKKSDSRITPGIFWDAFLWLSALGMLIAGGWLAITRVFPDLQKMI